MCFFSAEKTFLLRNFIRLFPVRLLLADLIEGRSSRKLFEVFRLLGHCYTTHTHTHMCNFLATMYFSQCEDQWQTKLCSKFIRKLSIRGALHARMILTKNQRERKREREIRKKRKALKRSLKRTHTFANTPCPNGIFFLWKKRYPNK